MLDSTFGFENIYYIIPILKGLSSRRKKRPHSSAILFVPFTPPANSLLHSNLVPCCKVYICSIRGHTSTRSETNLSPPIPTTFSSTIIQPYSFSGSSLNWYGPYWLIVQRDENLFFFWSPTGRVCKRLYRSRTRQTGLQKVLPVGSIKKLSMWDHH